MPDEVKIGSLSIDIVSSSDNAVKSLRALSSALEGLGKITSVRPKAFEDISAGLKSLGEGLRSVTSAISSIPDGGLDKLKAYVSALQDLRGIDTKAIANAMSGVADAKIPNAPVSEKPLPLLNTQATSVGSVTNTFEETAASARSATIAMESQTATFEKASRSAERATFSFQRFKDGLSSAKGHIRSFRDGISSAGSKIADFGKNLGSNLFKAGNILTFGGLGKATEGVKKFAGSIKGLWDSLKRIVMYRAIRSLIKTIANGIKEGTTNLYQWSKALGGEFAKSMDTASSSFLYFKNSIGAAAAPLVNAIVPALQAIIRAAVSAVNAINQLFATITGASYWTRAIEYPTEFAEAVDGAGGAAKDLQKYLAPFDELNVLPSPSGGGGGGAKNALDYKNMFEDVLLDPDSFLGKVRAAIEAGDWRGLGTVFGEKINEAMDNFDAESLGKKIGSKLSSAFQTLSGFINSVDFVGLGREIADVLNGVLRDTDWSALGETIGGAIGGLLGSIVGFIEQTDWGAVGTALFGTITSALTTFQKDMADIDWAEFGRRVIEGIGDFFRETDWGALFSSWFSTFGTALGGISAFIIGAIGQIWEELKTSVTKFWDDNVVPYFDEEGHITWEAVLNGIWAAVSGIATWLKTNVIDPFIDGFKQGLGISGNGESEEMNSIGHDTVNGFLSGITSAWEETKKFFTETLPDAFDTMVWRIQNGILKFKKDITRKFEEISDKISFTIHAFKENVVGLYETIRNSIIEKVTAIKTRVTTIFTNIKTTVESIVTGFRDSVVGFFNETRNGIIEKIQFVQTRVTSLFNGIVSFFENTFQKKWETAINAVTGFVDKHLVKPIQTAIDNIKGFWNDLKDLISKGISFPSIKLPHFKVTTEWNDTWKQNLPKIDVQWYARGGIVDRPTLIGAGEAGAEAIVPLENNTGWIRNVARELNGYNHDGTDSTATAVDEQTDALVSAIMDATARVVEEMSKHGGITLTDLTKRVTSEQSRLARAYGR